MTRRLFCKVRGDYQLPSTFPDVLRKGWAARSYRIPGMSAVQYEPCTPQETGESGLM